jgi:hypothetical protein
MFTDSVIAESGVSKFAMKIGVNMCYEAMEYAFLAREDKEQEEFEAEQAAYDDEVMELRSQFLASAKGGDVGMECAFAPLVNDYGSPMTGGKYPKRKQQLIELMFDQVDNAGVGSKLMELLVNVALDASSINAPAMARDIIAKMADGFANENVMAV